MTHPPRKRTRRGYGHAIKIPGVETQRCEVAADLPIVGDLHVLCNDADGTTHCWFCARSWAQLDAEIRAARGWRAAS